MYSQEAASGHGLLKQRESGIDLYLIRLKFDILSISMNDYYIKLDFKEVALRRFKWMTAHAGPLVQTNRKRKGSNYSIMI